MGGWIKLFRKMEDFKYSDNAVTKILFIHLLEMANTEDKEWQGITIRKGQFVSSVNHIVGKTGLSTKQIRSAIAKLTDNGDIKVYTTNKFSVFTICDYEAPTSEIDTKAINTTPREKKSTYKPKTVAYTVDFEEFWKIYPNKIDKGRAFECYTARIKSKTTNSEELLRAAKNYAEKCIANQTPQKYIKHGTTFLSSKEPFRDYLNMDKWGADTNEYRLAKFFEGFRQKLDNKYVMHDIQDNCELFHNLLENRRPNDIWSVMNALFSSNDNYLITKYLDVRDFCRGFSELGSKLMLKKN